MPGGLTLPGVRSRGARRRRWDAVSWWYSILFVIPVAFLIGRFAFGGGDPAKVSIQVLDAYSGLPLSGVAIAAGTETLTTDADGKVHVEEPAQAIRLSATQPGYAENGIEIAPGSTTPVTLNMRPTTLIGVVTDQLTGAPLADVTIVATGSDGREVTAVTGPDGKYQLADVPLDATLSLDGGDYGTLEEAIGTRIEADFSLRMTLLTGVVTDAKGDPLQGAIISAGDAQGVSRKDGTFRLTGVSDGASVKVTAPGYLDATTSLPAERRIEVALEPIEIRAIYANGYTLSDPDKAERLIQMVDDTELNALVIDIKQDTIYYDSQVQFFRNVDGMVNPIYDVNELLAELADHDIYAIARMVVFQDPLVAEAYPELAVKDEQTGDLWRNDQGVAWVNAFSEELWDANIQLAVEAASRGFDEIQYDYVRFPSDGNLRTSDFGRDYTAEAREGAITEFVKRSSEAIRSTGAKFAADLFGYVSMVPDEQGIGQRFAALVPYLDYVCAMIYPSHFAEGNIASAPGHPNDFPYETISEALARAAAQVPDESPLKFRPWLQDFSYGDFREYGEEEVRAQIRAAEEFGTSGWMLWDPNNDYTDTGIKPE